MGFPLIVARRYLFARRKQAIVFVISTISVLGVIVGVAALVVVL
ncbi:MAG TPA: lipoprotein-releasing system transmembrane subunit LolC, partial [Candidatus Polarisedimenticolia bacterium]|nr:lipoprotein-releasing system transmembrane subunit LolC [Candidatus Polarisedimenticolia bacterium]